MIEQIINLWLKSNTTGQAVMIIVAYVIICFLIYYFVRYCKENIVKRKTTTQKYREGLIKK